MSKAVEFSSSEPASHEKQGITQSGFWLRFLIYNCVIGAAILPIYGTDWVQNFTLKRQSVLAKQSEAKSYIGAINRAQQAYFLENAKFADSIEELKIGIPTETPRYQFKMWLVPEGGPFQRGGNLASSEVVVVAIAQEPGLKSYSGAVSITANDATFVQICETQRPSDIPLIPIKTSDPQQLGCPKGSKPIP